MKHRLRVIWDHMKQRCNNPNNNRYKNYGGRGIVVCDEWCEILNLKYTTVHHRIKYYNWPIKKALELR